MRVSSIDGVRRCHLPPLRAMFRPLYRRLFLPLLAVCGLAGCAVTAPPQPRPAVGGLPRVLTAKDRTSEYTRAIQTEPDTVVMQTGSRVFRPASGRGPAIELLGAVHIGEPAYYARLQRRMDAAGLVLFEGVVDERHPAALLTAEAKASRQAASVYQKLADLMGLVAQSTHIAYDRKSFERCDLTLQQLRGLLEAEVATGGPEAAAAKRALGEFATLEKILRGDSWLVNFALWLADKSGYVRARLKLSLVLQGDQTRDERALSPRLAKLIKEDRNAHVLRELARIRAERPRVGSIVVFYGSAHLPGLARGLAEAGYVPAGPVRWFDAIHSHPRAEGLDPSEISKAIAKPERLRP